MYAVDWWCTMMSNQSSYLREVRESQKVFSALVNAMEKSHKAVVAAVEARQGEEQRRVETLVEELEKEIQELRKETAEPDPQIPVNGDQSDDTKQVTVVSLTLCRWRNDNSEAVAHQWNVFVSVTQNIVSTVCPSNMKDWSKVTIETDPCVGVTRRALSDMMEKIKVEVNRFSKSGE